VRTVQTEMRSLRHKWCTPVFHENKHEYDVTRRQVTQHLYHDDNINVNPVGHEYPTDIPRNLGPYGEGNKPTALILHLNFIIYFLYIYIFL